MFVVSRTRVTRWAIGVALAMAVFGLAGAFGLPVLVRWGIETVGSRELGRALSVGKITANPFTLSVSASNLAMAEVPSAPGAPPFASIERLNVNLSISSLWRVAPVLDALKIDGLRARIVRTAPQRFNFSDIVERMQARPPTSDAPARFSLNNIEIRDGAIDLDDRVLGRQHTVTGLSIGIPFLSSLPTHADIHVQPSFAARINGTPLAITGETLPFDDTLESVVQLRLDGLDLPTYLGYSPLPLNFAIPRGKLDTDLRIAFRRAAPARDKRPERAAELVLSGAVAVREFALGRPGDTTPLLAWQRLGVQLGEVAPLTRRIVIDDVTLAAPQLRLVRAADGQVDWEQLARAPVQRAPGEATSPTTAVAPADAAPPIAFSLRRLAVADGRFHVIDESLGRFEQTLEAVTLDVSGLTNAASTPAAPVAPARFKFGARVQPQGSVALDGEATLAPLAGKLAFRGEDLQLRGLARMVTRWIDATIDGSNDVRGQLQFAHADGNLDLALRELQIEGRDLQLRGPAGSGATLDIAGIRLDGGELDLGRRSFHLGSIAIEAPRIGVSRLDDGSIGWLQLTRPASAAASAAAAAVPRAAPWTVTVGEVSIARGQVRFDDASVQPSARVALSQLQGTIRNLSADGSTRAELALRARTGSDGTLAINGGVRWDRVLANLRFAARNLDAAPARGYFARHVNATLVSGALSSRGTLTIQQPDEGPLRVRLDGDVRLADMHVTDAAGNNDLLRWQTLAVDRVALALGSGAPQVDVGVVALDEFYARVILSEEGRLNLADLRRRDAIGAADDATKEAAPPPAAEPPAPPPRLRIDRIQLAGGNVNFTDNFVRPNYTANLTDLAGSVTSLASDATDPATLILNGKVDNEAPLSINGRLNPLAPKLQLDIAASTRGVDLPRLTPYSTKYAGYPIVKGKLSLDLRYRIENDKLTASNHLFLDQLTFGERVESPTATKLPVLLAVALLKNSRGEIDINLPVAGSLDDPQFSIGGIIVKVIVNLLTKVVTAPFSLLAAAFGGGEELGQVDFAAGSARLEPGQVQRLQTLARALADRPGLRLDITGRADPAADTASLRDAEFEARLRAARVRQLVRETGASIDPAQVTIPATERDKLIAAVYDAEPIADKPRTLGIARRLPPAEMEQRIRAHLALKPADLRGLANARATTVRDWIETQGRIDRDRLFLVEPRIGAANESADTATGGGAATSPATRVEFSLK